MQILSQTVRHTALSGITIVTLLFVTLRAEHSLRCKSEMQEQFVCDLAQACARHNDPLLAKQSVLLLDVAVDMPTLSKTATARVASVLAIFAAAPTGDTSVQGTCATLYQRVIGLLCPSVRCQYLQTFVEFLATALFGNVSWSCPALIRLLACVHWLGSTMRRGEYGAVLLQSTLIAAVGALCRRVSNSLRSCPQALVDQLICALVKWHQWHPSLLSCIRADLDTLISRIACQQMSRAQVRRIYRLFPMVVNQAHAIGTVHWKETLLCRLVGNRVPHTHTCDLVSRMILSLLVSNGSACACVGYTFGVCNQVLEWCAWVLVDSVQSASARVNALRIIGITAGSAVGGTHKPQAGRMLRHRLFPTIVHMPASMLDTHVRKCDVVHLL